MYFSHFWIKNSDLVSWRSSVSSNFGCYSGIDYFLSTSCDCRFYLSIISFSCWIYIYAFFNSSSAFFLESCSFFSFLAASTISRSHCCRSRSIYSLKFSICLATSLLASWSRSSSWLSNCSLSCWYRSFLSFNFCFSSLRLLIYSSYILCCLELSCTLTFFDFSAYSSKLKDWTVDDSVCISWFAFFICLARLSTISVCLIISSSLSFWSLEN